jgi:hypothetical protein
LVRATLEDAKCRVKVQNNLSEQFGISSGLRQGDALSHILFNIALEKFVGDSGIETIGTTSIYNKTIQVLEGADDIVVVGQTTDVLKKAMIYLSKAAKATGLKSMRIKLNTQK